jgi:hypothetical protein
MMKTTIKFINENHPKAKYFSELTAKCALENNNTEFAWNAVLSYHYLVNQS